MDFQSVARVGHASHPATGALRERKTLVEQGDAGGPRSQRVWRAGGGRSGGCGQGEGRCVARPSGRACGARAEFCGGGPPHLLIADAHTGLREGIRGALNGVTWQRCTVYFQRNVLSRVPAANRLTTGKPRCPGPPHASSAAASSTSSSRASSRSKVKPLASSWSSWSGNGALVELSYCA